VEELVLKPNPDWIEHIENYYNESSGGCKDTEFGPKINVSMTEGFARVDQAGFNAFNEANYLEDQASA
jgi:hypothetical protein